MRNIASSRPALPAAGLFPPEDPQRTEVLEQIHQPPRNFGSDASRWSLKLLGELCRPLAPLRSLSGLWRRLQKWKIVLKRGRQHIHSPDPQYQPKLQRVLATLQQARANPQQVVLLYGDEKTVYRQPRAGRSYHEQGSGGVHQSLAELSHRSNTKHRLGGAMDAFSGQVVFHAASRMGVDGLCKLLEKVRATYVERPQVVIAWDNWPVHDHPKVLQKAKALGIELLHLPTYAPWTNPIEKLWRWLQERILDRHNLADRWQELKDRVAQFLQQFAGPAPALLRYVGLLSGP